MLPIQLKRKCFLYGMLIQERKCVPPCSVNKKRESASKWIRCPSQECGWIRYHSQELFIDTLPLLEMDTFRFPAVGYVTPPGMDTFHFPVARYVTPLVMDTLRFPVVLGVFRRRQ